MNDFKKIVKNLEINETMFNNAKEKYEAVANFLSEKLDCANVYTQGSFAIGTTVRPYKGGEELSYDIDLILEVERNKLNQNGADLLDEVYNILNENGMYKGKLEKGEKSITIKYADVDGIGFNLDIVPAITESDAIKQELVEMGCKAEYAKEAIAISSLDKADTDNWYTAIPRAYRRWFENINAPYKNHIFESIRHDKYGKVIYNSIEEVPHYKIKTPVQEVVQILKRLRDVHYYKIDKYEDKPISAIITTMVATVASRNTNYELSTIDLLKKVIMELKIYNMYNSLSIENFYINYPNCIDIVKENGEWKMINPVNPKDNLVDAWNKDKEISDLFFEWLSVMEKEVEKIVFNSDDKVIYENLFGSKYISKVFGTTIKENKIKGPKPYGEC